MNTIKYKLTFIAPDEQFNTRYLTEVFREIFQHNLSSITSMLASAPDNFPFVVKYCRKNAYI